MQSLSFLLGDCQLAIDNIHGAWKYPAMVIIMQAVPGAGKSTWIKNNTNEGRVICSADYYFMVNGEYQFDIKKIGEAHANCLRTFNQWISQSFEPDVFVGDIIVDNTNSTVGELAPYAALATAYGWDVKIVTLLVDPVVAWKRNVHGVALKDVMSMDLRIRGGIPHLPKYWKHEVYAD